MKPPEVTYGLKKKYCGTVDWALNLAHPSQVLYYWALYLSNEEINKFDALCLQYLIYFHKDHSNLYIQQ